MGAAAGLWSLPSGSRAQGSIGGALLAAVAWASLFSSPVLPQARAAADWDGDNGGGNFSYGNNWYCDVVAGCGGSAGSGVDLNFNFINNAAQTSIYYDWGWADFRNIEFKASLQDRAQDINGAGSGINFHGEFINNDSYFRRWDVPLSGKANPVKLTISGGDFEFKREIYNDSNYPYEIWGNNGKVLWFTTTANLLRGNASVTLTIKEWTKVRLSTSLEYGGSTALDNGELWFDEGGSLNGGRIFVGTAGAPSTYAKVYLYDGNGGSTCDEPITINGGDGSPYRTLGGLNTSSTNFFTGSVNLEGPVSLEAYDAGGATHFGGVISNAGAVVLTGAGTTILAANNLYTGGTTNNAGTLRLEGAGTLGSTNGALAVEAGRVDLNGTAQAVGLFSGAGGLVTNSSSTAAALKIGCGDATGGRFAGVIADNLPGTLALQKEGAGTLTLDGANTYQGGTAIRGGLLRVNGSAGTGRVDVVAPGALGGTGRVASLIVRDGGVLRPGASPGTLTATNITWSTNGVYEFEIMDFSGAYGATNGWDKLDVQGVLTVDAAANTFTVRVVSVDVAGAAGNASNFNPGADYTLPIASVTGATALVGFSVNQFVVDASAFSNRMGVWTILQQSTNIVLQYTYTNQGGGAYWDATNSLAGVQDGAGTWSSTNANWWNGVDSRPWSNQLSRTALFGAGGADAYTITVSEPVTARGIGFRTGGVYTVSGTGVVTFVNPSTVEVAAASASISSVLAGGSGWSKAGTGTLVLAAANTYTGGVAIKAGMLSVSADNNLGAVPGGANQELITLDGGTLRVTAGITLNVNRGIRIGAGGGVLDQNGAPTTVYNGKMAGAGALTFRGASGQGWNLGGLSTNTGGVTLESGIIYLTVGSSGGSPGNPASGPLGAGTAPVVLAGAQIRPSTGSSDPVIANTITITANTTFPNATGEKALTFSGPVTLAGGNLTLTVNIGASVAGKSVRFSGNIGDGGNGYGLSKAGTGRLILGGTNTYSGGTTISAGHLMLASSNALAQSTITNSATQGLLFTNGTDFTIGGLSGTSGFGLTNMDGGVVTLAIGNNNADTTYGTAGSVISGGGSLVKVGGGTLTMAASGNSYTGTTTIRKGVIAMSGGNDRLPTTTVLTLGDAVTDASGLFRLSDGTTARNQTVAGLLSAGAGASNRVVAGGSSGASTLTLNIAAGSTSFGGILGGGGANENNLNLVKSGDGEQVLTGTNTHTGSTTVQAGTLRLAGNRTAAAGAITVGNTAGKTGTLAVEQGSFALSGSFTIGTGNGTVTGVVNQTGGTLTASGGNQVLVGAQGSAGVPNAAGIYHLNGGTLAGAASNVRGIILGVNDNTRGTFNLSGTGVVSMLGSALQVARSDSGATNSYGEFNQTGGTATLGNLSVGGQGTVSYSGNTGVLYLVGGTFSATNFLYLAAAPRAGAFLTIGGTAAVTLPAFPVTRGAGSTSQITFDGGTLSPLAASATYISGLDYAYVTANGANLDVASGNDITIPQLLTNAAGQAGQLSKAGSGALTITNANTYTGGTWASNGTLNVYNNQTAANGGWYVNRLNQDASTVNFAAGSAVAVGGAGMVKLGTARGESNLGSGAARLNVAGTVQNAGALLMGRVAFLNIDSGGSWTQSATTVLDGIGGGAALLAVRAGGLFAYTGASTIKVTPAPSSSGWAAITNSGTFVTGRGFERTNTTSDSTGTSRVEVAGGGVLRLSTAVADLTVDGQAKPIDFRMGTGGGVIDTVGFDAGLSAPMSGIGSLTKAGAGTLTLAGTNVYEGGTVATGGTLRVNTLGASGTGTGFVDVAGSGALDGTGRVANLRVRNGGRLQPGIGGPGALGATNSAYWATNGVYVVEVDDFGGPSGWDWLNVGGTLVQQAVGTGLFTVRVVSLTYDGVSGLASNFSDQADYSLAIASAPTISGFVATNLVLDRAALVNTSLGAWSLVQDGTNVVLLHVSTNAVDGTLWDADNTVGSPQNGSGRWSTTDTNWWNNTVNAPWNNVSRRRARFGVSGAGSYVVTNTESIQVGGLSFEYGHYTLQGPAGATLTMTNGAFVTVTNQVTGTFAMVMSGASEWTKNGPGVLQLASNNTQSGDVVLDGGTVRVLTDQTTPLASLTFGSVEGSTNISSLVLSNASLTVNGLTVQTSNSTANTMNIGVGKTLTINGNLNMFATVVTNTGLKLTVTGGGAISLAGGYSAIVGKNIFGANNQMASTLDMRSLGTLAGGSAGTPLTRFVVGYYTQTPSTSGTYNYQDMGTQTVYLPTNSTLYATVLGVGEKNTGASGNALASLYLGAGANAINADTITIGELQNSGTLSGRMLWNTGVASGSLSLHAKNGTGAVNNMYVGAKTDTGSTSYHSGLADFSNGTLSGSISNLYVAYQTVNQGNSNPHAEGTFKLGAGAGGASSDLSVSNLFIGYQAASDTGRRSDGTVQLDGGTLRVGTIEMTHTAGGDATLAVNGGTLRVDDDITTGGGTETLNLGGGTLAITNHSIGTSASSFIGTFNFTNGAVRNVSAVYGPITLAAGTQEFYQQDNAGLLQGQISGATTLFLKTGTNSLTLSATNTFAGAVTIQAGTLAVTNGNALEDTVAVTLSNAPGALLLLQTNETIGSLSGGGGAGGDVSLQTWTLTVSNSASAVYTGVLSGTSGRLIKQNTGSLMLGGANTYSGGTVVATGTLILARDVALTNSTVTNLVADGLLFTNFTSFTLGGLAGTSAGGLGLTNLSGAAISLFVGRNNESSTMAGGLRDGGALVKHGTGTLTLSGTNSFAGGLHLAAGMGAVVAASSNALGSAGVTNDAVLHLTAGAVTYSGLSTSLRGSGTNRVTLGTGSGTTTLNGNYGAFTGEWIIGIGAAAGAGKAQLNGADHAGARIHVLTNGTVYVSGNVTKQAAITLYGGNLGEIYGQLRLDNGANWAGPVTLAGNMTAATDGHVGTLATGNSLGYISGNIGETDGPRSLIKSGSGTASLVLRGTNTYRGGTVILNGFLVLGTPVAITNSTVTNLVADGLQFTNATAFTLGGLAGTGGFGLTNQSGGAVTLTVGLNGENSALSGILRDAGGLIKVGTGTLTLSGVNSFSGGLTIKNGTVSGTTSASALGDSGAGTVLLGDTGGSANATLLGDGRTFVNPITVQAGSTGTNRMGNSGSTHAAFTAPLALDNALTLAAGGTGSLRLSGNITGTSTIQVFSAGGAFVHVNGTNLAFAGGVAIQTGLLRLDTTNALTVANPVFLNFGGTNDVRANLTLAGLADGADGGGTVVNGDTVDRTLTLGGSGSYTFSGDLSPATPTRIALAKAGTGTQTLSGGSSTYTRGTAVTGGTLRVMNGAGSATGTGLVDVAVAGVLDGTGRVANLRVRNGGAVSPGVGRPDTLTVTTDVVLTTNGVLAVDLMDFAGGAGATNGWDLLAVGGNFSADLTGGAVVTVRLASLSYEGAAGLASNFNPDIDLSLPIVTAASISSFDGTEFVVDTNAFANALEGSFTVVQDGATLFLTYLSTNGAGGAIWDATNSLVNAQNGAGLWSSTDTNWWNGTLDTAWSNLPQRQARFGVSGAGAYTVTLSEAVSAKGLSFEYGAYTLKGDAATPLTLANLSTVTVASALSGTVAAVLSGSNTWIKSGAGVLLLASNNTQTGQIALDEGTLRPLVDQTASLGRLTLGATNRSSHIATLNLSNANLTAAGLLVQHDNAAASTILIGAGKTLTITGEVRIGATAGETHLTVAGPNGAVVVRSGLVDIGSWADAHGTLDFGDLGTLTMDLGSTGILYVGRGTTDNGTYPWTLILAQTTTVTAAGIRVGAGPAGNAGTMIMRLGSSTNTFFTDDLYVGTYNNEGRSSGTLQFDTATGTFTLRGAAGGSSRADVHVENDYGGSTGTSIDGTVDLRNHSVDLMIGQMIIGRRSGGGGNNDGTFRFNSGTLNVNKVWLGEIGANTQNGWFDLQGGTVVINTNATIGACLGGSSGTARMNVGGSANVTSSLGFVVGYNTNGTLTAILAVSNNALLAVGGHISSTSTPIASLSASLILNGPTAVLDMNGKDIGDAAGVALDSFTITTGTVRNIGVSRSPITLSSTNAIFFQNANAGSLTGVVSGAGALTKTGTNNLILAGANTYSGSTWIQDGMVTLANSNGAGVGRILLGNSSGTTGATLSIATGGVVTNDLIVSAGTTGPKSLFFRTNSSPGMTYSGTLTMSDDLTVSNMTATPPISFYSTGTLAAAKTLTVAQMDNASVVNIGGKLSGAGRVATAGSGGGGWAFNCAVSDYSGGTTLSGASTSVVVVATDSPGPSGAPTSGPFGVGVVVLNGAAIRSTISDQTIIRNPVIVSNDTTFANIGSEHSLVLSGPVTLSGNRMLTANIGRSSADTAARITGAIGDGGGGYGITVDQSTSAGTGRLVLSGSNTYTGVTRIQPFGHLQISDYSGVSGYLSPLSAITNDGRLTFGGGDTITQGVHFAANMTGRGVLRRIGGGTVELNGSNSWLGGVSVLTGYVRVVTSMALGVGPATNALISATGALLLDGSAGNLTLPADVHFQSSSSTNYVLRNVAGTNTVNGTLRLTTGFGDSRIASDDGQLIWAGQVTNIAGANRLFGLGGDSAESNTVSGDIVNGGSFQTQITKEGTGTWVLAGANKYTGLTTVNAGRLVVTTASTGGGSHTLNGGTLEIKLLAVNAQFDGSTFTLGTGALELGGYETNQAVAAVDAGTLAVNGAVTVYVPTNLVATEPDPPAEYPLIAYTAKSGAGSFTLGTPVGPGVVASVEDTGTNIVLRVGSAQPVEWYGDKSDTWNISEMNWKRGLSHDRKFSSGVSVTFDDTLTNHPDVNVRTVVSPAAVVFSNSATAYSLSGTGRISGATGLVKYGTNVATLATTNLFTGPSILYEGVLAVARLPAGGVSGALGRASADATNLVLAGGTLRYTGPAGGSDRLFSVGTNGGVLEASGSGALSLTNAGALGFNGEPGPRTLTLGGTNQNANRLTASVGDSGGATALNKTGPGTWWLQGANSHGGVTTVGAGVLDILTDSALGTTAAGTVVSNGATLQLEGPLVLGEEPLTLAGSGAGGVGALYSATESNTVGGPITLAGDARIVSGTAGNTLRLTYTGALAGAGYTVTLAGAGDTVIEGGIGPGAGGLQKDGAGTLTLNGSSAAAGDTFVSNGALAVQGALNRTGALVVAAGGALSGTGSVGAVTVQDEGRVVPGGSTGRLRMDQLDLKFGSQLTYELVNYLSNDLIEVAAAGGLALNGGSFTLYEAGSSNRFDASGRYNLIAYSNSYSGDLGNLSVSNRSSSKEYIFGSHDSNITLTIRTTIGWDGSGEDLPADNLRWTMNTNWADGYVPTHYDVFTFGAATKGHFNTNDMAPNTVLGGIVFLDDASEPYVLDPLDATHVLNLAGGISNLSPVGHVINIPLAIQDHDQVMSVVSNSLALNGVISDVGGAYGLTLAGGYTLTLTGTNLYGGTTRVGTGTLQVNNGGGSATGSGLVDVFGAGALTGTGRVSGLQVAAGGTLSPGAGGPAVLTAGATTWGTNGVFRWEVNDFSGAHGDDPGRDRLLCTGVLTIAATAGNAFTVQVTSLTYSNGSGVASNFVLVNGYTQILASASGISGYDAAKFRVQTTNFHNPYAGAWSVAVLDGTNLALVYSPEITNTLSTTNGLAEPAFEAGLQWAVPGHRNVQGNPAAPWRSYAVFYACDGTEPTTNSLAVTFTNGPAALTNITTASLGLTNLSFDTDVRMAIASLDTLGRFGPLSAVVTQRTANFVVTQGLTSAESAVVLGWTARPGIDYDVIYQDAPSWGDTLTNGWALLESVAAAGAADTGSLTRLPPLELGGGTSRFYRVTRKDHWQTGHAVRTASREVYVARRLRLQPGENWCSLFATPEVATLAGVFGTNRLPTGGSPATATRISWYGAGTSNGQPVATAYLSSLQRWVYSLGGVGVADTAAVALTEGFLIEVPGAAATNLVLGGWLTTNMQSTTVYGGNRFNLLSYPAPRRMRVRDLGLREAGFRGAAAYNQFTLPDELRVLNNTGGNGSATSPRLRVWLKLTASETNYYVVNGGLANNTLVEPDEVLIWWNRGAGDQTWTANPTNFYRTPTPQMAP